MDIPKKIKRKIRFSLQGRPVLVEGLKVQRILPSKSVPAIGPFVLLDHVLSCEQSSNDSRQKDNTKRARPCRGIATLTYIIDGEVEHIDSIGNYVKLNSGGIHWMRAGTGVVYDEAITESKTNGTDISVIQFWINLSSRSKCQNPDYLSLNEHDVSKQILNDNAGWIKILLGKYENSIAKIPGYSRQFLYHIHLNAGKQFSTFSDRGLESAVFLSKHFAEINDIEFESGELIVFDSDGEVIEINNYSKIAVDVLLFGGEQYTESIVMEGAFVMNTPHEITEAYNDYYDGKYGDMPIPKK